MPDISRIILNSTMLHELPRGRQKNGDDSELVYSSRPTPLDPQTDRFIREQMLDPFLPGGREILDGERGSSPVMGLVREVLEDNSLLPGHSRAIADWMHKTQTGASSDGVFMAALATSDGRDRFVILKAEHQEGVRLNHSGSGDDVVFRAEHLTELIMGQNSKVYKIAVIWLSPVTNKLVGLMVDKQNGVGYADFFLNDFLGCDLTHRAEVLTQEFVKGLDKFLNSDLIPEEKRIRYATAAVAVLESPTARLSPAQFISDFIDPGDRDLAAGFIGSGALVADFRKDTTLVRAQIGGLKMRTDTEVVISASAEALSNGTISVEPNGPEGPQIVVKGTPDDYKFATRPR